MKTVHKIMIAVLLLVVLIAGGSILYLSYTLHTALGAEKKELSDLYDQAVTLSESWISPLDAYCTLVDKETENLAPTTSVQTGMKVLSQTIGDPSSSMQDICDAFRSLCGKVNSCFETKKQDKWSEETAAAYDTVQEIQQEIYTVLYQYNRTAASYNEAAEAYSYGSMLGYGPVDVLNI